MQRKIENLSERRDIPWDLLYLTHAQSNITIYIYSFMVLSCLFTYLTRGVLKKLFHVKEISFFVFLITLVN